MKKKVKILSTFLLGLTFALATTVKAEEINDYVDLDGNQQYGWAIEANEINADTWEFDSDGNLSASYAAEGDTANQWTWNYAIRNLAVGADDEYSVECTFTPDPNSDLSAERTYGLLVWYQDSDNFLIYWMQQKNVNPDWSGQFYGRVDGMYKSFYMPEQYQGSISYTDEWRKGEFYDMWWDQPAYCNPNIYGNRTALLTETVTLKVVSDISTVTVGGVDTTCRRFELHQVVNGVDKVSCEFYCRDINANSGDFYTGVYTNQFNVGLDYDLTCDTDFVAGVEASIDALPAEIANADDINTIIDCNSKYLGLLDEKANVDAAKVAKLEGLNQGITTYVDNQILALDENKTTFISDVEKVYEMFLGLPAVYQGSVTKTAELALALEKASNWVDPTTIKPVVNITTPTTAYAGEEVSVEYTVEDNLTPSENIRTIVEVRKDGKKVSLSNNKFTAEEGTYTIKVSAQDEHENVGTAEITLVVTVLDTEKPTIVITTPTTANVGDVVKVEYTISDNVSALENIKTSVEVKKDGQSITLSGNTFTAEEGTYTITISAIDEAKNVANVSVDVVVTVLDTTKPIVNITTPTTATEGDEIAITYTANDDITPGNKLDVEIVVTKDGNKVALTDNKFVAEAGEYQVSITVTDEAGNETVVNSTIVVSAVEKGCGGSAIASLFGMTLLCAAVAFVQRKKRNSSK